MHSNFKIQLDKNTNFSLKGSGGLLIVGRSGSGKTNTTTYIMLKAVSQCDCGLLLMQKELICTVYIIILIVVRKW